MKINNLVFIDIEVDETSHHVSDYGAVDMEQKYVRTAEVTAFADFVRQYDYIAGHNLLQHDWTYISEHFADRPVKLVDTLYLSALLMPEKASHALVKDYKIDDVQNNNPLVDAMKSRELFETAYQVFKDFSPSKQALFASLLSRTKAFSGFFSLFSISQPLPPLPTLVKQSFPRQVCEQAPIDELAKEDALTLAFALSLISSDSGLFKVGDWVYHQLPKLDDFLYQLRGKSCQSACPYCQENLGAQGQLQRIYGYSNFRTYGGEALQEQAVEAALRQESLVAIFPTGGGKSLTFQLPALIAGQAVKGLTVVISPLQSLMKDQVDHLEAMGLADGVAINGLLSPVERAEAFERVYSGIASILYLSPESLRLRSIERLLDSRNIVRFVIDEAHCFSAWGQDFRVDYLYIGEFIRSYQKRRGLSRKIPVSCFTATAKPKVIADISAYFERELSLSLTRYATSATRENLHYEVLYQADDDEKYQTLRLLLQEEEKPAIIYVSRTKRAEQLARRLSQDGLDALAYHGKMEIADKLKTQETFMSNQVRIIVATSAFGMGVDKSDVGLVVHYNISDSLENYVQEAGRAGRDPSLSARCVVLFNESDLDKHFLQLNQSKLSIGEIQQIWQAIKAMTGNKRQRLVCSALELARQAGWEETSYDIEMRVRTAVASLEVAGYLKRGHTIPHIYADSILAKNMIDISNHLAKTSLGEDDVRDAKRIMSHLLSTRSRNQAGNAEAESRIDYLGDILGLTKERIISLVQMLREEGILADHTDLTANFQDPQGRIATKNILHRHADLEQAMIDYIEINGLGAHPKQITDYAVKSGVKQATIKHLRTIRYLWTILHYMEKQVDPDTNQVNLKLLLNLPDIQRQLNKRRQLAEYILDYLFDLLEKDEESQQVNFSLMQLAAAYQASQGLLDEELDGVTTVEEIQQALLYLTKIGALHLEGGFLVLYSAMEITRLETNNAIRYKKEDYQSLSNFYEQRRHQIHIVGEYARLMVSDMPRALKFVEDYFHQEYKAFIADYFQGERLQDLSHNMTKGKFEQLFGSLSTRQAEIVNDDRSQYITVVAGPGSGKTRILVHKMAALLLLDDVKHDQLMMLTFSRAAAVEFKQRLVDLIGPSAHLVTIKTFHSYCFDLLGVMGNLEEADQVVEEAVRLIQAGEADPSSTQKQVLIIDEAQDMDEHEWSLIKALMAVHPDMRVIAVGDDDQAIYDFRGASIEYFGQLMSLEGASKYELSTNYRSHQKIVTLANRFSQTITGRLKEEPIISASKEDGLVTLNRYQTSNFARGLLEQLVANRQEEIEGQTAVLTHSNEEAAQIVSALRKSGIPAKLIQDSRQTKLIKVYEVRSFLENLSTQVSQGVIPDEVWQVTLASMNEEFADSKNLSRVHLALESFRAEQPVIYLTDFISFLQEVTLSDFTQIHQKNIVVSTIHKAKGREFDFVYLLLNRKELKRDEDRRAVYVGLTRAKSTLHLHYCSSDFDGLAKGITIPKKILVNYPSLTSLLKLFTLSDVYLGHAIDYQERIAPLRTGQVLSLKGGSFYLDGRVVARCSRSMREELERLARAGYRPRKCQIGNMVYWRDTKSENPKDYIVPLPVLELSRD